MRKLCILIADESVDAADELGTMCERWGHDVDFAYEGAFALESARQLRPDVIFLGVALPLIDGFAVARRLREHPAFHRTLLIALGTEDVHRSRDAGFDAELAAPADAELVQTLLGRLL